MGELAKRVDDPFPGVVSAARAVQMPTAQAHRAVLAPVSTWKAGRNGEIVDCEDWTIRVDRYTRLMPEADCRAIVDEIDAALAPAAPPLASDMGKILVGHYPAREVHDPHVFVRGLASIFAEAPPDIGWSAVKEITRHLKFLPAPAEVFAVCDRMLARRRHARRVAEAHLAEHARRKEAAKTAEAEKRRQAEFRAQWGEAWDAWMALPLFGPPPSRTRTPFEAWKEMWPKMTPEDRAALPRETTK